jgi:hypothetical protein
MIIVIARTVIPKRCQNSLKYKSILLIFNLYNLYFDDSLVLVRSNPSVNKEIASLLRFACNDDNH